jgi:hypothetical protein
MTVTAEQARKAFWTALRDLQNDSTLAPTQIPVFDEQDGPGGSIEGQLPEAFYQNLADELSDVD